MAARMFPASLLAFTLVASAATRAVEFPFESLDRFGSTWEWNNGEESGGGSSYLGVDIDDVSAERLSALKLKEEHGVEITTVDQDAPAGKAGLHDHDVIISVNGTAVESTAQMRRIIRETPPGRIVNLGVSRDGQPMTIKVQLADKHKSMAWEPKEPEMPKMPEMPQMPDFDLPVSVVIVHSSARSGLMVENISPQLGDFFGVKGSSGVLVRSVEKGSRGEKAGFRAGDVIVKVNNQTVRDTSDFTHVLRSSTNNSASVTVIRERREQNLTLSLPEKKDSGSLLEESFDDEDFTAETQEAVSHVGDQIAKMTPALVQRVERDVERQLEDEQSRCLDLENSLRDSQQKVRATQRQMLNKIMLEQRVSSTEWADI